MSGQQRVPPRGLAKRDAEADGIGLLILVHLVLYMKLTLQVFLFVVRHGDKSNSNQLKICWDTSRGDGRRNGYAGSRHPSFIGGP